MAIELFKPKPPPPKTALQIHNEETIISLMAARDSAALRVTVIDCTVYVAYRAMQNTVKLSQLASVYSAQNPAGAQLYEQYVQAYGAVCLQAILGQAGASGYQP